MPATLNDVTRRQPLAGEHGWPSPVRMVPRWGGAHSPARSGLDAVAEVGHATERGSGKGFDVQQLSVAAQHVSGPRFLSVTSSVGANLVVNGDGGE